ERVPSVGLNVEGDFLALRFAKERPNLFERRLIDEVVILPARSPPVGELNGPREVVLKDAAPTRVASEHEGRVKGWERVHGHSTEAVKVVSQAWLQNVFPS